MAKRFEEIQVGDQVELTADRGSVIYGAKDFNPDMVVRVAVVTDIWYDPVDRKEYVGLSYLKKDGTHDRPTLKHTITGLARQGWKPARKNYVEELEAIAAADKRRVVQFRRKKK